MPQPPTYTGVAVTPFVGTQPVGPTNPIPVTPVVPLPAASGILFAVITAATGLANGDNQVVAAVAGKRIVVLSYSWDSGGLVANAFFATAAAATPISDRATQALGGNRDSQWGIFQTGVAAALIFNVNQALAAGSVSVAYILA